MRQPAVVLIRVISILILSVSPEGKVTVAVALLFLICGVLTLKFFSQPFPWRELLILAATRAVSNLRNGSRLRVWQVSI